MNKGNWQEELVVSSQRKRRGFGNLVKPERQRDVRFRVRVLWSVFVVGLALIAAKIIYLQVIERGQHELTSRSNHIELKREVAARGIIYDRRGEVVPRAPASAPIVGYLSEVGQDELGCTEGICYSPGMIIGRAGVEKTFEMSLRGRDGGKLIEVNSAGVEVRELGSNLPEAGSDLALAIDTRLQEIMYQVMGEKPGSAVAIDMQGKVLGLVSSPSYDPTRVTDFLADKEKLYFLNRAVAGTYPPGSVFKLVTSVAGLSEGKITKDTQFEDTGEIRVGSYRYGNWYFDQYGRTEGSISLVRALTRSNDIYFYKVGEEVGVESLVEWAKKLGLGEKTGIELPGEQSGLVPDRLWKERKTGEKWFLGNTYHMAIGQGDLLVTPLQVARMTLAVVSGRLCQVSLLKNSTVNCQDLGLKTGDIATIREGMKGACATGGTAFPFFDFQPSVICKTGTAQHAGQVTDEDKAHAWITVAYPGENPGMILTVMLEAAGEGSYEAGPVAKTILEKWRDLGK
ncbi:MAG: penicillin-binding transpeptidase domain-containing protein [bacterium]